MRRALYGAPLSCRTSPPQGGRSVGNNLAVLLSTLAVGGGKNEGVIFPLVGEMSGRTRGREGMGRIIVTARQPNDPAARQAGRRDRRDRRLWRPRRALRNIPGQPHRARRSARAFSKRLPGWAGALLLFILTIAAIAALLKTPALATARGRGGSAGRSGGVDRGRRTLSDARGQQLCAGLSGLRFLAACFLLSRSLAADALTRLQIDAACAHRRAGGRCGCNLAAAFASAAGTGCPS